MKWYLVLPCISLIITGEPDSLFICLLTIWVSNSLICLFILVDCISISFCWRGYFSYWFIEFLYVFYLQVPLILENLVPGREREEDGVFGGDGGEIRQPHLFYCSLKPSLKK